MKKAALSFLIIMGLCVMTVDARAGIFDERDYDNDFIITAYGGYNLTFPGGRINDDADTELEVDHGYSGGLGVMWAPDWFGAVSLSVEYTYKPISVKTSSGYSSISETKEMAFINILAGWRGFFRFIYYEIGFFYGINIGDWDNDVTGSQSMSSRGPDGEIPDTYTSSEFGIYAGLGCMFWVTDWLSVNAGVQFQGALTYAYENPQNQYDDDIATRAVVFQLGVSYMF